MNELVKLAHGYLRQKTPGTKIPCPLTNQDGNVGNRNDGLLGRRLSYNWKHVQAAELV